MSGGAWDDAKEAVGCLLWVVVIIIVIPSVLIAAPKIWQAIDGWQP